jgi:hypothetical protein
MDLTELLASGGAQALPFAAQSPARVSEPPQLAPAALPRALPPLAGEHLGGAGAPRLTVSQYASLRVELDLYPGRAQPILARYQLSAVEEQRLGQELCARAAENPSWRQAYEEAYQAYRAYLQRDNAPRRG